MQEFILFYLLTGDAGLIDKFNRRLVKVTKQHSEECKELLKLMGVPYVDVSYQLFLSLPN